MVLHNSFVLARAVDAQRQYRDLTHCPGDPEVYGVFNPILGQWLEQFDRDTCLQRLQGWVHQERVPGQSLPLSQVTMAGRRWLAQQT